MYRAIAVMRDDLQTVFERDPAAKSVVELVLAEGKYREVRRLFESQGRSVIRLQRVQVGNIKLGELRPGRWRTLTPTEIKSLLS